MQATPDLLWNYNMTPVMTCMAAFDTTTHLLRHLRFDLADQRLQQSQVLALGRRRLQLHAKNATYAAHLRQSIAPLVTVELRPSLVLCIQPVSEAGAGCW